MRGAKVGITEINQRDPQSGLIIGALISVSVVRLSLLSILESEPDLSGCGGDIPNFDDLP